MILFSAMFMFFFVAVLIGMSIRETQIRIIQFARTYVWVERSADNSMPVCTDAFRREHPMTGLSRMLRAFAYLQVGYSLCSHA